ncbi:TatD family hydrolase [Temperatibacter marinus]|uniref:TatD family hydrolase n=1 Tax=Temperatibacter marinus TaxID=1456591 RepID=A0AA52EGT9_9PROT|nr:TatD family hydrolase [Temperatibacter marinus]WND02254.1 TatD family hydrolase [Temperatibacter marinus]
MSKQKYGYLVDSHCHLNYGGLSERLEEVLANAKEAGIGCLMAINTKIKEYPEIIHLVESHDHIFGTVGIHPHQAEEEPDIKLETLLELSKHPKIVGIGETGLDYFYDNAPREMQQDNFRTHIRASQQTGLPIIIHTRDADADCISILQEESKAGGAVPGLIHCFTATQSLADAALDLGMSISISGIVTFKNAGELREVVKTIPLDRLLVETDAPFLAPIPHRGKKCEPAFAADTAKFLADLKGIDYQDFMEITSSNYFTLFRKVKAPASWTEATG